jgi:hypothetical protein
MNITKTDLITCLFAGLLLAVGPPDASAGRIKCWTNEDDVTECGNVVPPEYAQKGHKEISEQGRTVGSQTRAKTPEEIEQERLEEERKERERALAEEQAKRDRILLATFATEDDMQLSHNGKVAAIDSRITHTEQLVKKLGAIQEELIQDAAKQERSGNKVSEQTLNNIRNVKHQIAENQAFILQREEDRMELEAQFEKQLARFRTLKSP